jgi:hypothetical protein
MTCPAHLFDFRAFEDDLMASMDNPPKTDEEILEFRVRCRMKLILGVAR